MGIMSAVAIGLSGCMDMDLSGGGSGTDSSSSQSSDLTVWHTEPDWDNDTDVPINRSVLFEFSERMDLETVSNETVSLKKGSASVAGTVTAAYNLRDFTFTPTDWLAPNTEYTLSISTGVESTNWKSLQKEFTKTFRTGTSIDSTPPTVVNKWYERGVCISFSDIIDPTSFDDSSFHLTTGGVELPGQITYTPRDSTMCFQIVIKTEYPDGGVGYEYLYLARGTTYTVTPSETMQDLAGNALGEYTWTFTTPP